MAVRIISEDERLKKEIDGSIFIYRRCPQDFRNDLIKRKTPRRGGDPDWGAVGEAMLKYSLLDWENVEDGEGKPVPFDPKLIPFLPEETQTLLLEELGANIPHKDAEAKNL